ncbi:hypothetical protein [Ligilactobacillus agilis]|uniref:hypothetical protein n=1 Tax=Ligilactobacillus agilis TaxID=1601 RepID=UPI0014381D30|nr:hypothetical protein [Ligilactobacillus agilis]MBM6773657.1 hypothetical protein [Ligilactobacillus agilis]MCI5761474.1 hypothetical protein [Ligilactobacillus agilis]GET18652.1 hypothetical protein PTL465_09700 [Ligilactobacillus agilis]
MIDNSVDVNRLKKIVELSDGNMEVCTIHTIIIPITVNTVGVAAGAITAYKKYHRKH